MGNISNKNQYVHDCKLPREGEVISFFIPNKYKVRQAFRKSCLISSNINHRKLCIKSFKALEQDRAIHLTQNYYMIHPFSAFSFYWENFMLLVYFTELTLTPYFLLIESSKIHQTIYCIFMFQIITMVNIVVKFCSGYLELSTNTIILEPKKIVKYYMRRNFIPDFLASFPFSFILYQIGVDEIKCRFIACLMFFDIINMFLYTDRFREKKQITLCQFRIFQFSMIYFLGILWVTVSVGLAAHVDQQVPFDSSKFHEYFNAACLSVLSKNSSTFIFYGYELFVHFVAVLFGFIIYTIIIAQIILLCKSKYSAIRKYKYLLTELNEFAHYKKLPAETRKRVREHYHFLYQNYYYNEQEILSLMSDNLKTEIEQNYYKIWFETDIFRRCSQQLVNSLVTYLKREVYLTDDIIYKIGQIHDTIYFLKCGTISLLDENKKELLCIEEGHFFADSALLPEESYHIYYAMAKEPSEIYKLNRTDFLNVIKYFPEDYKLILEVVNIRLAFIKQNKQIDKTYLNQITV